MGHISKIKEENPDFDFQYAGTLKTPINKVGKLHIEIELLLWQLLI
jgi:hypothetical protein